MKTIRIIALASVSLLAMPTASFGQAAPAKVSAAETSGEVIVTARRRDEKIQEVPQVVNAITAESIQKLNIRSASEITTLVPGLSLTINANGIGSSSSLRGINHDVNVSGENGTVQYYVNDVPTSSNFTLQAMYDIDQISVERGPQGTLRGRSTPSGSINIGWKKPSLTDVGAYVAGQWGSANSTNVNFGIGVPIIKDVLGVRVSGLYDKNRGNRVTSLNSIIMPEAETQSIRASVLFKPVEFLKMGFTYQALNYDSTQFAQVQSMSDVLPGFVQPAVQQSLTSSIFPFGAPVAGPSVSGNYGTLTLADRKSVQFTPTTVHQDFKFYSWNAELSLAGQKLIYLGSKLSFNFHPVTNQDPGAVFPTLSVQQDTSTSSSGTTHEIRLQNADRVAGMFDYVVGYFQQSSGSETLLSSGSVLEIFAPTLAGVGNLQLQRVARIANGTPIYLPLGATTEKSYYGNVIAHITDKTEFSAGLRHVNFVSKSAGLYVNCTLAAYAAGTCALTPGTANAYDVSKTVYNASLRHRFSDNFMLYASTGSSFRPPVRAIGDFSTSYSPLEVAHTAFGAETSKSYEIGFKSDWMDKKLRLNATLYHQDFTNYPYRAAGAGVYYININAAGAPNRATFNFISAVPVKVNGIEADLAYRPTRNFSIATSINWSKSTISKSAKIACTDINKDGIPDIAQPTLAQLQAAYGAEHLAECPATGSATFLPEWSGTVQAEYNVPLSDSFNGYLRGLLSWKGSTRNDEQNPNDNVGAYGIINLYAGLRSASGKWDLGFYAKNVANVTRLTSGDADPASLSTTMLISAGGPPSPFGSQSYSSNYRNVSVTAPRELGVSLRVVLGSR